MSNRVLKKPVAVAIGAALISSIAAAGVAQASSFAVHALGSGFMLAAGDPPGDEKPKEGKCGEGKCGSDKAGEGKCGEGKCGEGKCGEGKCGSDKAEKPKDAEPPQG